MHPPAALACYERAYCDPARRHAMSEDYRAAVTVDQEHDRADLHRTLPMPLLTLWGARGAVHELYEPLAVWRGYARDVRGHSLDAGHFLVDERPDEVVEEVRAVVPR